MVRAQANARRRWRRRGYAVGLEESVDMYLSGGRQPDAQSLAVSVQMEWDKAECHGGPTAKDVRRVLKAFGVTATVAAAPPKQGAK